MKFFQPQVSFAKGELTPLLAARVDLSAYQTGAKELTNMIVLPQGAVINRPGVARVMNGPAFIGKRILDFVFNETTSYVLAISDDSQVYVYKVIDSALTYQTVFTLPATYQPDEFRQIRYLQSADVMYLFHRNHQIMKISRFGDVDWRAELVELKNGPFLDLGDNPFASTKDGARLWFTDGSAEPTGYETETVGGVLSPDPSQFGTAISQDGSKYCVARIDQNGYVTAIRDPSTAEMLSASARPLSCTTLMSADGNTLLVVALLAPLGSSTPSVINIYKANSSDPADGWTTFTHSVTDIASNDVKLSECVLSANGNVLQFFFGRQRFLFTTAITRVASPVFVVGPCPAACSSDGLAWVMLAPANSSTSTAYVLRSVNGGVSYTAPGANIPNSAYNGVPSYCAISSDGTRAIAATTQHNAKQSTAMLMSNFNGITSASTRVIQGATEIYGVSCSPDFTVLFKDDTGVRYSYGPSAAGDLFSLTTATQGTNSLKRECYIGGNIVFIGWDSPMNLSAPLKVYTSAIETAGGSSRLLSGEDVMYTPYHAAFSGDGSRYYVAAYDTNEKTLKLIKTTGIVENTLVVAGDVAFTADYIGTKLKLDIKTPLGSGKAEYRNTDGEMVVEDVSGPVTIQSDGVWAGTVTIYEKFNGEEERALKSYVETDGTFNFEYTAAVAYPTRYRIKFENDPTWAPPPGTTERITLTVTWEGVVTSFPATITGVDAFGRAVVAMDDGTQVPPKNIRTQDFYFGAFGSTQGYPALGCFFQERLVLANTRLKSRGLWLSKSASWEDFGTSIPLVDTDAISLTLASKRVDEIVGLSARSDLLVLTTGAEWLVTTGSRSDSITPSSYRVSQYQYNGCAWVDPLEIGDLTFYVQRGGREVLGIGQNVSTDGYASYTPTTLSVLSEHLFKAGVVTWCYQQDPWSVVWTLLEDGSAVVCTSLREHEVLAWGRCTFPEEMLDTCSVPGAENDLVVFLTKDGKLRLLKQRDVTNVDSFIDETESGTEPVSSAAETLSLEQNVNGSIQSRAKHVPGAMLRVHETGGFFAGIMTDNNTLLDQVVFPFDESPVFRDDPFTGDVPVWAPGGKALQCRIRVENTGRPLCLLGIFANVEMSDDA